MSNSRPGHQTPSSPSVLRQGRYSSLRSDADGPQKSKQHSGGESRHAGPWNDSAPRGFPWKGDAISDKENTASPTSIAEPMPSWPSSHRATVPEICVPALGSGSGSGSCAASVPPQRGDVTASGPIHFRTASLLSRKWKPSYWAHVYPTTLVVFQSQNDFCDWRRGTYEESRESIIAGEWDGSNEKLAKLRIELDPMGILRKREKKERRKKEKEARKLQKCGDEDGLDYPKKKKEKGKKKSKDKKIGKEEKAEKAAAVAAAASQVVKYAMTDVSSKTYVRNGPIMHTFKVERWTEGGTNVAASFASSDPLEVKELRRVVRESLNLLSKDRSKSKKTMGKQEELGEPVVSNPAADTSVMSGMTGMLYNAPEENASIKNKKGEEGSGSLDAGFLSDGRSALSGASTAFYSAHESPADDSKMARRRGRRGRRYHGMPASHLVR